MNTNIVIETYENSYEYNRVHLFVFIGISNKIKFITHFIITIEELTVGTICGAVEYEPSLLELPRYQNCSLLISLLSIVLRSLIA